MPLSTYPARPFAPRREASVVQLVATTATGRTHRFVCAARLVGTVRRRLNRHRRVRYVGVWPVSYTGH